VASESTSLNAISNTQNGTITSSFLLTIAGSYSIVVYFNGSSVFSSAHAITVFPGEPFLPNFFILQNHFEIMSSETVDIFVVPVDKFMNSYKSTEQFDLLDMNLILKDDSDRSSKYLFELGADSLFVSSFRITKSGLYSGSIFIGSDFQIETAVSVAVIQTSTPSAQTSSILIANRTWTA